MKLDSLWVKCPVCQQRVKVTVEAGPMQRVSKEVIIPIKGTPEDHDCKTKTIPATGGFCDVV